jgi:hypothetical protein
MEQETCNLRCLFSDYYIKTVEDIFYFKNNVRIKFMGCGLPWYPVMENHTKMIADFYNFDYVYFNIGNHYSNGPSLNADLEKVWETIQKMPIKKRPFLLSRLQSPVHFHTEDGHMRQKKTPQKKCITFGENFHFSPTQSFRYSVFKSFVEEKSIPFFSLHDLNIGLLEHPTHHDGKEIDRSDCLHYVQNSWDISVANAGMLSLIDKKHAYHITAEHNCSDVGNPHFKA